MSNELLASKVIVVEEEPKVRGIASASTSVVAAVGIAEQGPLNTPALCTSFDEYAATFGNFTPTSDLALAAKGFFENGGSRLWVSRVGGAGTPAFVEVPMTGEPDALPASVTSANPAPFVLSDGDDLIIKIGEDPESTTYTILYQAYPATAYFYGPFALADGQTLELQIDGQLRTVTFSSEDFVDIGAATAAEVGLVIAGSVPEVECTEEFGTLIVSTVSTGRNTRLELVGGSALPAFGYDPGTILQGDGSVGDLNAVTAADILGGDGGALVDVEVEDVGTGVKLSTTAWGATARIQIIGGSAAAIMGFDNDVHVGVAGTVATVPVLRFEAIEPGAAGNDISVQILSPSGYDLRYFAVSITRGATNEYYYHVSRDPEDPEFVETLLNAPGTGSALVRATNLPAFGKKPSPYGLFQLAGGGGGGDPSDSDFIGDEANGTGLYAFDNVADASILIVPGRATPAVHNAMLTYCEVHRDGTMFAILDPPPSLTAAEMVTYASTTASLENASEYGAIYWPRVKILNPKKSVFGDTDQIVVAPSGILAGVYARTDGARPGGVYDQPAGVESGRMFGVLGFETTESLNERKRDLVFPHRINPLTSRPGRPAFIDGARTLKGSGSFPFVGARRGAIFIERSLKQGLQFVRHKSNTPELRSQVRRTITAFLLAQTQNGAFASKDPSKAFFVDVSDSINPPSVVQAGKLVARVGIATSKPAEYLVLLISQDTRALEEELAPGG
jgi:phage tail sheath protein FI